MASVRVNPSIALACLLLLPTIVHAQIDSAPAERLPALRAPETPAAPTLGPIVDPLVQQASGCCALPPRSGLSSYGCGSGLCVPGQQCHGCDEDTHFGRLVNGTFGSVCCPDPCYEPRWILEANAAFFQDSPRPVTQTRIRWDTGINYRFPDTAEFFWGKIGTKGPANPVNTLRYGELSLYQEIAAGKSASAFFDMSYRSQDSGTNPSSAGLGDLNVGAKSVVLDRELILLTTQFRTQIPAGNFSNGLGTGHVALEPSILSALKVTNSTYLQTQLAYWIPLGGTPGFAGSTFHYHVSVNQGLYQCGDFLNVVGTVELNGYSFRGQFTDFPSGAATPLSGRGYMNVGSGLRIMFCDRVDIGVGSAFGITEDHGPAQLYRAELRMRF